MRIVYLLLSPTFGMHQYTADLANRMAETDEVFLVTTSNFPKDRYSPAITMVTPVATKNTGMSIDGLRISQLGAIRGAVEGLEPDVVHITGPHLWNIAIIRRLRKIGIPIIHSLHDLDPHKGSGYGWLLHVWNKLIIRSSNTILVHGEIYRERLIKAGKPVDSVVFTPLLHLFLRYESQITVREAAMTPTYDNMLLFFGRIEEYKGAEVLLKAYQKTIEQISEEAAYPTLILAGPGKLLEGRASRLPPGVEWRNKFINDEEAIALFKTCSIVVLPYVDGTQSAVISSAYYFNKPVISTSVGALSEYVDDRKTGLIVDPDDPGALSQAILSIIDDESTLRTMGTAGRKWYDNQRISELSTLQRMYGQYST
jgi:glycosyltransferase involved in cell wall biosynthesis